MRLVEVVMLMGAHCVSPVEHSHMMTEATKVQCAVVIEKNTDSGTVTVTPQDAARDPQVTAAMARFSAAPVDAVNADVTRIVPAWAPAGSPPTEVKPPLAMPIAPPPEATSATTGQDATSGPVVPEPEKKVATLTAPPQKPATARKAAAPRKQVKAGRPQKAATARPAGQCKGTTTAKWYTAADGKKSFRCVKQGSSTPAQLY